MKICRAILKNNKSIYFWPVVFAVVFLGGCVTTQKAVKPDESQDIYVDESGNEYVVEYQDEVKEEEPSKEPAEGEIVILEEPSEVKHKEKARAPAEPVEEFKATGPKEELPIVEEKAEIPYTPPEGSKKHKVWIWQETKDCLWTISEQYYGDPWKWKKIYLANQDSIEDPNVIFPKQILVIPPDE